MQAEQFIIWLKGFLEACGPSVTVEQIATINEKLDGLQLRGPFRERVPAIAPVSHQNAV